MENSKIQWTDHTFNPWHGCIKISPGCKNCYAEAMDKRFDGGHWGPSSSRKLMSDKYWEQPLKWNKTAQRNGVKKKVFCASMADVFEGNIITLKSLKRLFDMIEQTPHLIWQLLTKRPENIMSLIPKSWIKKLPDNVWIGTSIENQEVADYRIDWLLCVPAKVRFISCEPLLGPIDLGFELPDNGEPIGIHWVIVGGESGISYREMNPEWVENIKNQCEYADIPFFFKQWGKRSDGLQGNIFNGRTYLNFPK